VSIALVVVAACAAMLVIHDASASASSTQVLRISAVRGMLRFNTTHLTAHAGTIEIEMSNPAGSGFNHGIAVSGHGVKKVGAIVKSGHVATVTATLKAGNYTFYCPVPGHEAAGMKGTLTVS
jgi:plastocyanin